MSPDAPTPVPPRATDPGLASLQEAFRTAFFLLKIVMVIVLAAYLLSGIFQVDDNERAVLLRFGKFVPYEDEEGRRCLVRDGDLYWAFPYPIDEHVKAKTDLERSVAIRTYWYHETGRGKAPDHLDPAVDGYAITGDLNIVHYKWTVRYVVSDFATYFATFRGAGGKEGSADADRLIEDVVSNAIVRVTARTRVDDLLYHKKAKLKEDVLREARAALAALPFGECLEIRGATLDAAEAPRQTAAAFREALNAAQVKDRLIRKATTRKETIGNVARKEALAIVGAAREEAGRIVSRASADAGYLKSILDREEYRDPVTRRVFLEQLFLETLEEVLAGVDEKYVLRGSGAARKREIRYILKRDPEARRDLERERRKKAKPEGRP
jgi:membrane protease subunit HflK